MKLQFTFIYHGLIVNAGSRYPKKIGLVAYRCFTIGLVNEL